MKQSNNLFTVIHEGFATDKIVTIKTVVEAESREKAMQKLNEWLAKKPHGEYTDFPCESVEHVRPLKYLS